MTDPDPHAVDPADEGRHVPTDEPLWNESHYLDFVTNDGAIAGYARIGLYPNLGVTWWTTMLVGPDRPLVASMAYDWAVPTEGLALRGADYTVDGDVEARSTGCACTARRRPRCSVVPRVSTGASRARPPPSAST